MRKDKDAIKKTEQTDNGIAKRKARFTSQRKSKEDLPAS